MVIYASHVFMFLKRENVHAYCSDIPSTTNKKKPPIVKAKPINL